MVRRFSTRTLFLSVILPSLIVLACLVVHSREAAAYPWMIRYDYAGCIPCHGDPSGQGLLTPYGRAQSAIVLSTDYGGARTGEPPATSNFLFGVVESPEWLLLQAWTRDAYHWITSDGTLVDHRLLMMRSDVAAEVMLSTFRAAVSLGVATQASAYLTKLAWVTQSDTGLNLVSREHWAGASLASDTILVRAGRLNLPFGLRNVEHISWVRSETRTDINQYQQHGIAFAYYAAPVRTEVMFIAGNYQVSPDAVRERGYSGYFEHAIGTKMGVGLSSKVTHTARDYYYGIGMTRQAHGVYARYAPIRPLALLAEFEVLITSSAGAGTRTGQTSWLQVDVEPIQGLHFDVAGETLKSADYDRAPAQLGFWAGVWWFPYSHFDARFDTIVRGGSSLPTTITYLVQVNAYL